jgi:DNA-binding XRE family transcriptional regulator
MSNRGTSAPTKEQVLQSREAANLTQEQAAELVYLSSFTRWSEYERGVRKMEPSRFELFKIKTGQHERFGPLPKPRRSRSVAAPAGERA